MCFDVLTLNMIFYLVMEMLFWEIVGLWTTLEVELLLWDIIGLLEPF